MSQPFGATNKPHTCLWCGRKLRENTDYITRKATSEELAKWEAFQTQRSDLARRLYNTKSEMEWASLTAQLEKLDRKKPLRLQSNGEVSVNVKNGKFGLDGEDLFDTRSCAEFFGTTLAKHGRRLQPRTSSTEL